MATRHDLELPALSAQHALTSDPAALASLFHSYRNRPVDFVYDFLIRFHPHHDKLSPYQIELLEAINENKLVSIRSGTGTRKTTTFGFAGLWFLATRPFSLVPTTGPKADQLKDTLWAEIQRWLIYSPLNHLIRWESERISHKMSNNKEIWCMVARTASEPQNLAGFHADNMLFMADEGSAIKDAVFEIIMATLKQPDNRLVTGGQPYTTRGFYFDTFHKNKDIWKNLHFDSEKDVDPNWAAINRMKRTYGENSDIFKCRTKGEFPSGNPLAFIQYEDAMKAINRTVDDVGAFELGVDVARFGDDLTAIAIRRGNKVYPIETFSKLDTVQVSARAIQIVRDYREKTGYSGSVRVKIDDTGVGGGVTDILRRNKADKLIIVPINFSTSPKDGKHADMTTKLYEEFKNQLQYIELPNDEDLIEELTSRRRLSPVGGMIKIEPKDRFKSDYRRSPDRADALVLAFARGADPKRVWPAFHQWNEKQCRAFNINWKLFMRKNAQIYVTMYQEEDMTTSLLPCLWDGQDGKLYIFGEIVSPNPRPENIIPRFTELVYESTKTAGIKIDYKKFLWYANQEMFGLESKARSMKNMRDGTAMAFENPDFGIFMQPNLNLDLPGAQSMAGSMMASNMILIHSNCEETVKQFTEWRVENGKPITENCGLCLALCNIVSLLHQWGQTNKFIVKLPAYSPSKEYSLKQINEADENDVLTEFEANKMGLIMPRRPRPGIDPINL